VLTLESCMLSKYLVHQLLHKQDRLLQEKVRITY